MCGIAGKIRFRKSEELNECVKIMTDFLHERGPDASGYWSDENLCFGHTRLSIIDLSVNANQPFITDDDNYVISYNGEVYNYLDLRSSLEKYGYKFRTESDTEVILNGFLCWGESVFEKLDGMFSISIYDKLKKKVFLARDPFGKKPLYYFIDENCFLFSSDIRSIWFLKHSQLTIDFNSLDFYLTECSIPQPNSIWNEIKQVEPGTYQIINIKNRTIKTSRYFQLENTISPYDYTIHEVLEITEDLLRKAIIKRTVADVPVGCFLSSGTDSGLVVSILASNSIERINTFTCGFKDSDMNEIPEAEELAGKYHTKHISIKVDSSGLDEVENIVRYFGEPFADYGSIPSFLISREMSKNFKVALSGDGGDELFGGYEDYGLSARSEFFLEKYPKRPIREFVVILDKLFSRVVPKRENFGAYNHYLQTPGSWRLFRQMGFTAKEKLLLYDKFPFEHRNNAIERLQRIWDSHPANSDTDQLMKASLSTRLLNDYLVKLDRTSMMNSLEVRSPFLDKELAQFAFSIPWQLKYLFTHNKFILKSLGKKYISKDIFDRPKKGFALPLGSWLQQDAHFLREKLLNCDNYFQSLFSYNYIEELINRHVSGDYQTRKLWTLVVLAIWLDHYKI